MERFACLKDFLPVVGWRIMAIGQSRDYCFYSTDLMQLNACSLTSFESLASEVQVLHAQDMPACLGCEHSRRALLRAWVLSCSKHWMSCGNCLTRSLWCCLLGMAAIQPWLFTTALKPLHSKHQDDFTFRLASSMYNSLTSFTCCPSLFWSRLPTFKEKSQRWALDYGCHY